jgi:hypothetical protein
MKNDPVLIIETGSSGKDLMSNPVLNKATAFDYQERIRFDLHGLLPPVIETVIVSVNQIVAEPEEEELTNNALESGEEENENEDEIEARPNVKARMINISLYFLLICSPFYS